MTQDPRREEGPEEAPKPAQFRPDRIALMAVMFLIGGFFSHFSLPPFPALPEGLINTIHFVGDRIISRPVSMKDITYEGTGLVTHDPDAAQPGYTLIQGVLPGGPQIRMLDMSGREVHRWDVDFFAAWDDPQHLDAVPISDLWYNTQGFLPLSDGSVLVNISEKGSVMLDRCSRPLWTVDRMMHHSVTDAGDGKYWIPSLIPLDETPDDYFAQHFPRDLIAENMEPGTMSYNNSIALVGDGGAIEKEFSVLQAIVDAKLEHVMTTALFAYPSDPVHLNDIEVVTTELANKIPGVEQGDLLFSARNINMLGILDQSDGHLKWHHEGPWTWQHDPDIMPDGTIEVFNNRNKLTSNFVDSSQILSFDPATGETRVLYPLAEGDAFFTWIEGAHQRQPNGNILISETYAGRIFEVTPDGKIAWDYRLPYDDEAASMFEVGMRVPLDFFDVDDWNCDAG
ncbi:arylsulfotransferase family protein [Thalassovita aquimarina]|uniref:Arylsulfotransferase (ASST) n=1 Tax=Thalassovita aquimarina TaxID=2785917 RepID=A0ABS5HUU7_9RHOB|nr:arylsulfotransferase family protein [Thalassovita aquimarina]MBR9652742.1 hypothetical protein [Thalassovita aquimarina]